MKNTTTDSFTPVLTLSIIRKLQMLMLISDTPEIHEYRPPEFTKNRKNETTEKG